MKIYEVGGAVRDRILGCTPKDRDYVVVGSNPSLMLNAGYKQVGASFPVFLHPDTKEEYALARIEKKVGVGYNGFVTEWEGVTLEQDLLRRDLTINAIAFDGENYIDPLNGISDINNKVLRATSSSFKDDPLRLLRLARFKARYGPEWTIAECTMQQAQEIADSGELDHLVPERVGIELIKALNEPHPSEFFKVLCYFGFFPEICDLYNTPQRLDYHPEGNVGIHTMMVVDYARHAYNDPVITFAALCHDFGKPLAWRQRQNAHNHDELGLPLVKEFAAKWKLPAEYSQVATRNTNYHTFVHSCLGRNSQGATRGSKVVTFLHSIDAFRRPWLLEKMLKACEADSKGRGKTQTEIEYFNNKEYPQRKYLLECLKQISDSNFKIEIQDLVSRNVSGDKIKEFINEKYARIVDSVKKDFV